MWHFVIEWKGATWPNEGLPRGTPILANDFWFVYQNFLEAAGFDTRTSTCYKRLHNCPIANAPHYLLYYKTHSITYIVWFYAHKGGEGPALSSLG
jgi:hypothetical protein